MSLLIREFTVKNLNGVHLRVATRIAREVMHSHVKARIIKEVLVLMRQAPWKY